MNFSIDLGMTLLFFQTPKHHWGHAFPESTICRPMSSIVTARLSVEKKMASGVFTWAFYGYLWVYGGFLWVYGMMVTGLYRFRLVYLGSTLTLIARNMSRKKVTSPQDFSSWHPASNLWKNPARPRSANAFVCWKDGSVGLLGGAVELANE